MVDPSLQAIFEGRARALARRPDVGDGSDGRAVVAFAIAGERYAVDTHHAVEVGPAGEIAQVPGLPPIWAGVVNVRGSMRAVLDLGTYLELPPSEAPPDSFYLVFVAHGEITIGLLSDSAPEFTRIDAGSLRAPVSSASKAVEAVTPDFLSILDVRQLIDDAS